MTGSTLRELHARADDLRTKIAGFRASGYHASADVQGDRLYRVLGQIAAIEATLARAAVEAERAERAIREAADVRVNERRRAISDGWSPGKVPVTPSTTSHSGIFDHQTVQPCSVLGEERAYRI